MSARWIALLLLLPVLVPALPSQAAAQIGRGFGSQLSAGPRVGRDFENKAWTVGGQLSAPLGERLELRPSGDLLFPSGEGMGWQLNGDAAIRFGQGGGAEHGDTLRSDSSVADPARRCFGLCRSIGRASRAMPVLPR